LAFFAVVVYSNAGSVWYTVLGVILDSRVCGTSRRVHEHRSTLPVNTARRYIRSVNTASVHRAPVNTSCVDGPCSHGCPKYDSRVDESCRRPVNLMKMPRVCCTTNY